jgi:ABC-2 type transport system permease protein
MTIAFPVHQPRNEGSLRALVVDSFLQTQRLLKQAVRSPGTMIQAVVYPAAMLVVMDAVLGSSVSGATGQDAIYGYTAMVALLGSMFGASSSGYALRQEREEGLLARFWVLPVHRASALVARLASEFSRILLTTLLIFIVGYALGLRFNQGPLAALAMIGVPLLFGLGYATMVTAFSVASTKAPLMEMLGMLTTVLMFFNSGFVPTFAYPSWLRGFVRNQPMSCAIDAMKGLSMGGEVFTPLMKTIAWSVGFIVIFAVPAVLGYKKAAGAK